MTTILTFFFRKFINTDSSAASESDWRAGITFSRHNTHVTMSRLATGATFSDIFTDSTLARGNSQVTAPTRTPP